MDEWGVLRSSDNKPDIEDFLLLVYIMSQLGLKMSVLVHPWRRTNFPSGSSRVTHLCYWPQVVMLRWAESWWEKSWVLSPAWTCPKSKGQVKPWIKHLNRLKIGFKSLFLTMMFVFIFSFLVSFNKPSPIFDANQHEWIYMWGVGWGESLASQ